MPRSHVSFAFACNFHSREDRANMSKVFQVPLLFMLLFPCARLVSLAMALSQHGSVPDPGADTHTQFLALPRRLHTPEEATYMGGLLVGEVVEWAKGFWTPPHPNPHLHEGTRACRWSPQEGVDHGPVAPAAAGPPRVERRPPYPRLHNG